MTTTPGRRRAHIAFDDGKRGEDTDKPIIPSAGQLVVVTDAGQEFELVGVRFVGIEMAPGEFPTLTLELPLGELGFQTLAPPQMM